MYFFLFFGREVPTVLSASGIICEIVNFCIFLSSDVLFQWIKILQQ